MAKTKTKPEIPVDEVLKHEAKKRPSVWAQIYTKLRGKPYRFEQLMPDGSLDLRKPYQIPFGDPNIGLRGQRQFLQQILDDQHPWKAIQKSRQCGASENEVRETLWFGDTHPYTKQVYVFPTFNQVADFSKTRIEEVMRDSPYVRERMGIDPVTGKKKRGEDVTDSVRLRKIGDSWIFFRSGHSAKAAEGVDLDVLRLDEIDRIPEETIISFNEALSASSYGWRRYVSTPTLPGVGVNKSFSQSDQRHWLIRCPHCNTWISMIHEFPRIIVELPKDSRGKANHDVHLSHPWIEPDDLYAYQCTHCKRLISDETRIKGIWVPLYPENTRVRGYQISQLFCAWISAHELMMKQNDYPIEQMFINYVIGLPYLGDNVMITREDILRCVDTGLTNPYHLKRENVVIGVDWGNTSWGVAGMRDPDNPERFIILDIWNVSDADAMTINQRKDNPHIRVMAEKMRQWDARRGVFDAGYGKDRNWELAQTFPGRVFSCFYPNMSTAISKHVDDKWNEEEGKVDVDRTLTLKLMTKMFRDGKIVIPDWVYRNPLFDTFVKHLTNLVIVREIVEDENTKKEQIFERIGTLPGGDHFGHAMNYLMIGLRKVENSGKSAFFF